MTTITSCVIGFITMVYVVFDGTQSQPLVRTYEPNPCEYHFSVDGTDSTLLYTIYSSDGILVAKDILASKIDSVITADNE